MHHAPRPLSARSRMVSLLLSAAMFASMTVVSPEQSYAASRRLKVTAKVKSVLKSGVTSKVVITAKSTRRARFKVTVYKNGKKIRVLRPKGTATKKTISWNTRNSKGHKVGSGTYKIKVTAVRNGKAVATSKKTTIRRTPAPPPWIGYYVPGVPADMDSLYEVESATGSNAAVVNFFINDSNSFPTGLCRNVRDAGAVPLVTLEFWSTSSGGLSAINNGSKDAYLRKMADEAKAYGGTVWLRPFHEMNGNWYPWAGTASGNSPAQLRAAWRRVHGIFRSRGATNVKFVWCVNSESVPNTSSNAISAYWPGSAYVDYAALDGYNFGTSNGKSTWRSFSSVFGSGYSAVKKLTGKQIIITETSCATEGGSKSAWIADMFRVLPAKFPRIRGVVWFNADKERDWRIESSSTSLEAFKTGVAGL